MVSVWPLPQDVARDRLVYKKVPSAEMISPAYLRIPVGRK